MAYLLKRIAHAMAQNLNDRSHFHPGTGVPFPCADPNCAAAGAWRRSDGG